ncbi:class I SAM-dependent methyltransferase [Nocardia sp. NPDC050697]|uniref:class I SAM-dependent methyltransferase n=1 Tax=Nocardia sp. NPDC050697 TaxID=3155158 RepID=UPI0033CC58E5
MHDHHAAPPADISTREHWDTFYRDRDQVWSGNPNPILVREAGGLTPGTALDLGSGEGGDAIWLAGLGWRVTAVDVSQVALDRAAGHAAAAGVGERITWAQHDLHTDFPAGRFDLVSAQFLHSQTAQPGERDGILRKAAAAVTVGGALVIGSHQGWPSWMDEPPFAHEFPTLEQVQEGLALGDDWQIVTADLIERDAPGPDGQPGTRADSVLHLRRLR